MFIKFKKISFKNFLSYGNITNEFSFEPGLNTINGINGVGKSVLQDALAFALYGQPYRKIKKQDLVNWNNKKKLWVKAEFEINDNQYIIERTLVPDSIKITKNGIELDVLSSKKLTQSEIDKILGLDYNLFKQILSLSINFNRPFLSLQTPEKRDIIESIFNIKIFGEMSKIAKRNMAGLRMQNEIHKKTINILESALKTFRRQINDIAKAKADFELNKQKDLVLVESRISETMKSISELDKQIELDDKEISVLNLAIQEIEGCKKLIDTYKKELAKHEFTYKNIQDDIKNIQENDTCPFCKIKISEEHRNLEIPKLNSELLTIKNKALKCGEMLDTLNKKMEEYNKSLENLNNIKNRVIINKDKLQFLERQKKELENSKQEIEARVNAFNVTGLENNFQEKVTEYKKVYKDFEEITYAVKNYDIVCNILSENGIRSYFFSKLIPILNTKINYYLDIFDLPVRIEFNEFMEEKIMNFNSSGGKETGYYSFSEGEKKRIDIAIILSFIDITKMICNW
ncbi:MAG: AAA family ATPase, partial [Candidatus Woesearchaeota archaeon]